MRQREPPSYARFLFRHSIPDDPEAIDELDLIDNLQGELDRLHAIAELLEHAEAEHIPPGTSQLLRDIWDRAHTILTLWTDKHRTPAKTTRKPW
jgi:hypothetical protein